MLRRSLCFVVLLCTACTPELTWHRAVAVRAAESTSPHPAAVSVEGVPVFPADGHQCGPAALASVLVWSRAIDRPDSSAAEALAPEVYSPKLEGSLGAALVSAARRHGTVAYAIPPNMAALFTEVAAGHPVVVLRNLGLSWIPIWHYSVVTGFDLERRQIVLAEVDPRMRAVAFTPFEHTWRRSGYWSLVALPPPALPAAAEPGETIRAIAAFADTPAPAALDGALNTYRAAAARWPDDALVMFAAATAEWQHGDSSRAEALFRTGLEHHPDDEPLLNNYAQFLHDTHRPQEALAIAQHAAAINGRYHAQCLRTLEELRCRTP